MYLKLQLQICAQQFHLLKPTFLIVVPGLQQPQLVVVEVCVATSSRPRKECVGENGAASIERIRVVMVASVNKIIFISVPKSPIYNSKKLKPCTFWNT